jgi:hypothetical protein
MEKRALRSSARLAAQAAASSSAAHPDQDKNTDASSSTAGPTARHKALYKPNPLAAASGKEGVNRRVKEDAQLRKQRRDELVSAKRFKRSKETEEAQTGGNIG